MYRDVSRLLETNMAPENGCWKLVSFWVPAYFQVGPYDRYKWSYNPCTRLYDWVTYAYFTLVIGTISPKS